MAKASEADRAYFERVARANRELPEDRPPSSLDEMFDRMQQMRERLGAFTTPGVPEDDHGDLESHLAYLERLDRYRARGSDRS